MARKRRKRKSASVHAGLSGMKNAAKSTKDSLSTGAAIPRKKEVVIFVAAKHTQPVNQKRIIEVFRSSAVSVRQDIKRSSRKRKKREQRKEIKRFSPPVEPVVMQ